MITTRGHRRRLALTILAVVAVMAVFVIRLVDLQVVQAAALTSQANARRTVSVTTYGTRGSIVDRNGVVLADSVERFDLTASPKNADLTSTWMTSNGKRTLVPTSQAVQAIADLTGADPTAMWNTLSQNRTSDFAYLARKVTLDVFTQVKALGIPWVYSELNPARSYPNGAIAGNLTGFVGTDGPLAGTELAQNSCLAAQNGTSTYEASADGVRMPGSTVTQKAAVNGGQVQLTIDSNLQYYAQQVLTEQGTALGAQWGAATIVNVKTGQILAAADSPSIDPNNLNSVAAADAGSRVFTASFEPGSVVKVATFASMLDAGLITPTTPVTVPSLYTQGLPAGTSIKDAEVHGTVKWTATGVLMNSSNIGTSILDQSMTEQQRYDALTKFGLGKPTAVNFLGESANHGYVASPSKADVVTQVTQMFGQGMTATQAQIASLYQTIGNHGVRMPLTLVSGCQQPDGSVTNQPSTQGTRVISANAADTTVSMMEQLVSQGFMKSSMTIPGYRIAAKTGTAEIAKNGVYTNDHMISVAALVPAGDPQYAIVVTFAKPTTVNISSAAGPAMNAIMKQVIKTFRIQPSSQTSPVIPTSW